MAHGNYTELLKRKGIQSFLWTQFLEAFNDNVFKFMVCMIAIDKASGQGSLYTALAGGIFVLPFLLFSGYSAYLADVFSKRWVMIGVKAFEIFSMVLGLFAVMSGDLTFLLVVLFLLGVHSTFFSPAKYGILPEMLPEEELSRANGLLEMTTFMAIILGSSLGGFLFTAWRNEPAKLNALLIAVAVIGFLTSFGIPKVKPSGSKKAFKANPFWEIQEGLWELRNNRTLWLTVVGISYFWCLGAFIQLDLLLLGREVMNLSEDRIALLGTALAVGIGIGSLIAGKLSGDKIELGLIPIGSIGMGFFAFLVTRVCHHSFPGTLVMLSLLGFSGGIFAVPLNALLQQKAEKDEKGRILATNNFMNTLGTLLSAGLIWLFGRLHMAADQGLLIMAVFTLGGTFYILTILPDFFTRFVLWLTTHSLYRVKVVGDQNVPKEGAALLVCNHISWVDGLLVGTSLPRFVRFMVYKPIYKNRWLNWMFRIVRAIPTANRTKEEVIESIEVARQALKDGDLVCIFAEGGITPTGNLMPFKRGLERIVKDLDVPIIPVNLDGLWGSIFSFKDGRFFFKKPRQVPYPVTVSFGKPLPSTTKAEEVRQAVQELGSDATQYRSHSDNLPYRFLKNVKRNPFAFAMADSSGKEMSYGQTLAGSLLMANWVKNNCAEDKNIGVLLPSSIGAALANLGVSLSGKVPVNLNFTAGAEAMEFAVKECGLRTILTSKLFLHKAGLDERPGMVYLEDVMKGFTAPEKLVAALQAYLLPAWLLRLVTGAKQKAEDTATIIFSSGSTGTPKGVVLSHANILSNIESLEQIFWVTPQDRVLGVLPFFHSFGFTGTLWFPMVSGFGAVYHVNPMDAKTIGELVQKYKATVMISTPTFYSTYVRKCEKEQFASLRFAVVGAEKLRETVAVEFKEKFGLDLLEGYGATEMSPVVSVNMPDYPEGVNRRTVKLKPGTVGHPIPGVAVKVINAETGETLPCNTEGLLLVKGPNRMVGYLNQPQKTAEVLKDGWYVTGDIAVLDEDGFIKITDRLSRFSKIGGEMVPFGKVEEAVSSFLGEHFCAVTAVPDEQKGEKLVVLYTDPQMKPEDLWTKLSQTDLPKLWIPKRDCFKFVEKLPLLGSGKLDLKGLKQMAVEFFSKLSEPKTQS